KNETVFFPEAVGKSAGQASKAPFEGPAPAVPMPPDAWPPEACVPPAAAPPAPAPPLGAPPEPPQPLGQTAAPVPSSLPPPQAERRLREREAREARTRFILFPFAQADSSQQGGEKSGLSE